jgi:hypothetical protein
VLTFSARLARPCHLRGEAVVLSFARKPVQNGRRRPAVDQERRSALGGNNARICSLTLTARMLAVTPVRL